MESGQSESHKTAVKVKTKKHLWHIFLFLRGWLRNAFIEFGRRRRCVWSLILCFHCEEKKAKKVYFTIKSRDKVHDIAKIEFPVLEEEQQTIKSCVIFFFVLWAQELKLEKIKKGRNNPIWCTENFEVFCAKRRTLQNTSKRRSRKKGATQYTSFIQSRFMAHCFLYLRDN